MAKENTKVMAAKPAKAAPAAKPQKTPNPESFFNRFAKPVGKLGLVGAITAGSIGFVNELTKDQIATNWYEFALSSYMEMGDSIEGWERHETEENFNIISEGTSGTVTEYMVYCETAIAEDCTTEADMLGIAFKAEANHGGYGNMIFQVAVSTATPEPTMVAYNQLGFVTSFAKQTGIILDDLDEMAKNNVVLAGGNFISGASTSITTGGINSMLGDMRTTYDAVAVDPVLALSDTIDELGTLGNITNKDDLKTKVNNANSEVTFILENNVVQGAKLENGEYIFTANWTGHATYRSALVFYVKQDLSFEWGKTTSNKFATDDSYGNAAIINWLNNSVADISNVSKASNVSGASETNDGASDMYESITWFWANKGGLS